MQFLTYSCADHAGNWLEIKNSNVEQLKKKSSYNKKKICCKYANRKQSKSGCTNQGK